MGGMDERAASEILVLDMRRRVAEIKAFELSGVTLAKRYELGMVALQAPRLFDVRDRNDPTGAICEGVAGNRKRTKHINDHGNAAGCTCACLEIKDLDSWWL